MKNRNNKRQTIIITFLLVLTSLSFISMIDPPVKANPFSWTIYHIDTGDIQTKPDAGQSMALQSDGDLGVVYIRNTTAESYGDNICYAVSSDNGETWSIEDVYDIDVHGDSDDLVQYKVVLAYNSTDVPFIGFTNRSSPTGTYWNNLMHWDGDSWEVEQLPHLYSNGYIGEMRLLFNSSYQRRPMVLGNAQSGASAYDGDCWVWRQGTSEWEQITIDDAGTFCGRSMCAVVNSTGTVYASFLTGDYHWGLYRSENWGTTWTDLGNWNNHGTDAHLWGDMIVNETDVIMTAWDEERSGETVWFDYYDGSFHTDEDTTGDGTDYNYENIISLIQNETGAIHVAYAEASTDNVQLCWEDNIGGTWSEETLYSGNATNGNDAWLKGYLYDDGYHYVVMTTGGLTSGVGGDGDLIIAVRYDHVEQGEWTNTKPTTTIWTPTDDARDQAITPTLKINITDPDMSNQTVNITWQFLDGDNWYSFAYNETSVNATGIQQALANATDYNTFYKWRVIVHDNATPPLYDNSSTLRLKTELNASAEYFNWWLLSDTENDAEWWDEHLTYSEGSWSGEMIDEQIEHINISTFCGDSLDDNVGQSLATYRTRINATWNTKIGYPYPYDVPLDERIVHYFPGNHDYGATYPLDSCFAKATGSYNITEGWINDSVEVGREYNYTVEMGNLKFIYAGADVETTDTTDGQINHNGTMDWLEAEILDAYNRNMNAIMITNRPISNSSQIQDYTDDDPFVTWTAYWSNATGWEDMPLTVAIEDAPYSYDVGSGSFEDPWVNSAYLQDENTWDDMLVNQSDEFWSILNGDYNAIALWIGGNCHQDPDDNGGMANQLPSFYNASYQMEGWDSYNGTAGRNIHKSYECLFVDELHAGAWSDPNDEYSRVIQFEEGSKNVLIRTFEHELDDVEVGEYTNDRSFSSYAQDLVFTDVLKWAYDPVTPAEQSAVPIVTTQTESGVEETNATLNGYLTSNGSEDTTCYVLWDDDSNLEDAPLGNQSKGVVAHQGSFNHDATSLTPGTKYYFDTKAHNSEGWDTTGGQETLLTKPNPPTEGSVDGGEGYINVSWTAGTGADRYYIRYDTSTHPTTRASGTLFDNVTTTYANKSLGSGTYYFSIWSYASDGSLNQYSDDYNKTSGSETFISTWYSSTFDMNATVTAGSMDIEVSPATWTGGEPLCGTDIQNNFTFYQNGSATVRVDIGFNNTNYTFVNYTTWASNGGDQYCANFTIDSWSSESMIEPKVGGDPVTILKDSLSGSSNFDFGVRIWMPKGVTVSGILEDFEIVLVATDIS